MSRAIVKANMEARGYRFRADVPYRGPRRTLSGRPIVGESSASWDGREWVYRDGGFLQFSRPRMRWQQRLAIERALRTPPACDQARLDEIGPPDETRAIWLMRAEYDQAELAAFTAAELRGDVAWYDDAGREVARYAVQAIVSLLLDPDEPSRDDRIVAAMAGYTGRRTKRKGWPWLRPLRVHASITDISSADRRRLWARVGHEKD